MVARVGIWRKIEMHQLILLEAKIYVFDISYELSKP